MLDRLARIARIGLLGLAALLLAACGRSYTEANLSDIEAACRASGLGDEQCACVREQVASNMPADQLGTDAGEPKLEGFVIDCRDGQADDIRTAIGWSWDFIYYTLFGGQTILMFIFGWEIFLGILPFMALISLVQLLLHAP